MCRIKLRIDESICPDPVGSTRKARTRKFEQMDILMSVAFLFNRLHDSWHIVGQPSIVVLTLNCKLMLSDPLYIA
jgi:hypothetical protein